MHDTRNIRCTLLPGRYDGFGKVPDLYNEIYKYWKESWGGELTRIGDPKGVSADNFFRQHVITVLQEGKKVVGTVSSTIFNLSAETTYDHPFFQHYPEFLKQKLRAHVTGRAVTGEYMWVDPDFRKPITGIPFADVLIGLYLKVSWDFGAKASFCTPIHARKVQNNCRHFGFEELGTYDKFGVKCVMTYNDPQIYHDHPDPQMASLIDSLWENRNDLTGLTRSATPHLKVA